MEKFQLRSHLALSKFLVWVMTFHALFLYAPSSSMAVDLKLSKQEILDEESGAKERSVQKSKLSSPTSENDMLTNITALASAALTVQLLTMCTPTPMDLTVASAGGGIWVMGEILAHNKFKSSLKEVEANFVDEVRLKGDDTEKQIEYLVALQTSYMKAKSAIEQKVRMQSIAVMTYAAAAMVAAVYAFSLFGVTGQTNCTMNSAANHTKDQHLKVLSQREVLFMALAKMFLPNALALDTLPSNSLNAAPSKPKLPNPGGVSTPLFFLSGAAIGYFAIEKFKLLNPYIQKMRLPLTRIFLWGGVSLLLSMALDNNKGKIREIDNNIKRIQVIIKRLQLLKMGGYANKMIEKEFESFVQSYGNSGLSITDKAEETLFCTQTGTLGNCPSATNQLSNLPMFSSLPVGLRSLTTSITKVADGLNGQTTIGSATLGGIDSLSGNSSAIRSQLKNKTQELLNLGKDKNGKVDFEKKSSEMADFLKSNVKNSILKSGNSITDIHSGMSGISSSEEFKKENQEEGKSGNVPLANLKKGDAGKNSQVLSTGNTPGGVPAMADIDLNFTEVAKVDVGGGNGANGANETQSIDDYEVGNLDVSKNSAENLFKIISGSYYKSGYPKLLEEDVKK